MTAEPETAEKVMRSRSEAFHDGDARWSLRTWHLSPGPARLELKDDPRWRGLQIVAAELRPADG